MMEWYLQDDDDVNENGNDENPNDKNKKDNIDKFINLNIICWAKRSNVNPEPLSITILGQQFLWTKVAFGEICIFFAIKIPDERCGLRGHYFRYDEINCWTLFLY